MKIFKKIIFGIFSVFVALILIYNIYNFICINMLDKKITTVFGHGMLEVVSGSMEPTIHVGDIVVINTKNKNYKEGDIVTFYDREGSFVTHRIVSIVEEKQIITQGDNNNTEDDAIFIEDIVGKYEFKINGAGKLLAALKSPFTMIMILIIGILVCVYFSTDKDGNPILDIEEKEYLEFQEYLKEKKKKQKDRKYRLVEDEKEYLEFQEYLEKKKKSHSDE